MEENTFNPQKLDEMIALVKQMTEVKWGGGDVVGKTDDGKDITQFPYPVYPNGLYEGLYDIIEMDHNYIENRKKLSRPLDYGTLTKEELSTALTSLVRTERFCDGTIAAAIENGSLLKILERIKEVYGASANES